MVDSSATKLKKRVKELQDAMYKDLVMAGRTYKGEPEDLLALVNEALQARLQIIVQQALNSMGGFSAVPPDWFDRAYGQDPATAASNTEPPLPDPYLDDESYNACVMSSLDAAAKDKQPSVRGMAPPSKRLDHAEDFDAEESESAEDDYAPDAVRTATQEEVARYGGTGEDDSDEALLSTLKGDQPEAFHRIAQWASNPMPKSRLFMLKGYAGTGKTHMLKTVARWARRCGKNVVMTAPTNKAARTITKTTGSSARTIQSTLGYKMVMEGSERKLKRNKHADIYFPRGTVLVVDEASMLDEEMLAVILEEAQRWGLYVLFVGDPAQLPPVGETKSKVWSKVDKEHSFLMRQVVRYDSALLDLSIEIRKSLIARVPYSIMESRINPDGETGVHLLKRRAFDKKVLQESPSDYLERPILCWRNTTLRTYIQKVRDHFGFEEQYVPGEPIMTLEPTFLGNNVVDPGNTEFTIKTATPNQWEHQDEVMSYWLLESPDLEKGFVKVPKRMARYEAIKSRFINEAHSAIARGERSGPAWADYWKFVQTFTPVNHGYALTLHRAQGSTYQDVFLDQHDVSCESHTRTRNSLMYVGVTRPTTNVFTF